MKYYNRSASSGKSLPPAIFVPYFKGRDNAENNIWLIIAVWLFVTYFSYGVIGWILSEIFPGWLN